ncbi:MULTISPECIES: hypothetical protein [Xenorhabdus]|uniref:hypothetical protein n=1 Tax=Xenorhabdus TaxID=626 RepID=UPI00068F7840|nr:MULTISPECIES: hypothetical protein [Xenorhabdus]
MINKKVRILTGLILSLFAGIGMAEEKDETKTTHATISSFSCKQLVPHGEYVGKLDKVIHISKWHNNPAYWFVSLDRSVEGCIGVNYENKIRTQLVYDAFILGKTVTVRIENDGGNYNSYVTAITY